MSLFDQFYMKMWLADWENDNWDCQSFSQLQEPAELAQLLEATGLTADQLDEFISWLWEHEHYVIEWQDGLPVNKDDDEEDDAEFVRLTGQSKIIEFSATEELLFEFRVEKGILLGLEFYHEGLHQKVIINNPKNITLQDYMGRLMVVDRAVFNLMVKNRDKEELVG